MERFWQVLASLGPISVATLSFVVGCILLRKAQIRHYERFPVSKSKRRRNRRSESSQATHQ